MHLKFTITALSSSTFLKKSNQSIDYVCFRSNEYKYIKIKNPRKFKVENEKRHAKSLFWPYSKDQSQIFIVKTQTSKIYFVKLSTNRNKLSFTKTQSWQGREMYEIAFLNYFSFQNWKNSLKRKKLLPFLSTLALYSTQFFLF